MSRKIFIIAILIAIFTLLSISSVYALCGNYIVEAGEQCDYGNPSTNPNCLSTCMFASCCGNNVCESGEDGTNCPADCCHGAPVLTIQPSNTTPLASFNVSVTGLSNCGSKSIGFLNNSCSGIWIKPNGLPTSICSIGADGTGCSRLMTAPGTNGLTTVRACVDINGDTSYTAGEYDSKVLTVATPPTCSGNIALVLAPNSTGLLGSVTPTASGLASCSGKSITFKSGSCNNGAQVSSCTSGAAGCSGTAFTAPNSYGTFGYSACVDKNGNANTNDAGENTTANLAVVSSCSGNVALSLNPNSTTSLAGITPTITGLSNCNGFTVSIKNSTCAGPQVSSCLAGAAGCTGTIFTASGTESLTNYAACIDKNVNGNTNDAGENTTASLTVNVCLGNIAESFSPNPLNPTNLTVPSALGLTNCTGKAIFFKNTSCAGATVNSCTSGSTGCSGPSFAAPSPANNYLYAACINKNSAVNNNFLDAGESDTELLNVTAPACSGNIALVLAPNSTGLLGSVTPTASGLASCSGKSITFKSGSCNNGAQVSSCTSGAAGCSGTAFTAPNSYGTFGYSACVDKNGNANTNDAGENTTANLAVVPSCSGPPVLTIQPSNTTPLASFNVSVTGLSNCGSKYIYFYNASCSSIIKPNNSSASICLIGAGGTGCSRLMTAPGTDGLTTVRACIDLNGDSAFGAGEFDSKVLTVATPPACNPTPQNCDKISCVPNGNFCQCGSECQTNYCTPGQSCADCTTNADCQAPENACKQEQGSCVAGNCVYTLKIINKPAGCSCVSGNECVSNSCGPTQNCTGPDPNPVACSTGQSLDNCGGDVCPVCVVGYVQSGAGAAQVGATVNYDSVLSRIADTIGYYWFGGLTTGTHSLQAVPTPSSGFNPTTVSKTLHTGINPVSLIVGGGPSTCTDQCVYQDDPAQLCRSDCQGTNGCMFSSSLAQTACANVTKDFIRNLGNGSQVQCCTGVTYPIINVPGGATVNATNAFTVTRTVFYAGQLVKMKIVVFK